MSVTEFDYETAFCRNTGWLTPAEQDKLRSKVIAIAGLGGVGGSHLTTLARLGIGRFKIADPDQFELANFNRQMGATMSSIGRPKVDVLREMALEINPTLELQYYNEPIGADNIEDFLQGVDVYVDGLDFFAMEARRLVFEACAHYGIPAVTAAPLGMGAAVLVFLPGRMTFEEYFQLNGCQEEEQLLRFLVGLSPRILQRNYLVVPESVDFASHSGPSTAIACDLCAGFAAAQVFKILTDRGEVIAAPRAMQFDAYRNKAVKTWRPGGNKNPLQRIIMTIARKQIQRSG